MKKIKINKTVQTALQAWPCLLQSQVHLGNHPCFRSKNNMSFSIFNVMLSPLPFTILLKEKKFLCSIIALFSLFPVENNREVQVWLCGNQGFFAIVWFRVQSHCKCFLSLASVFYHNPTLTNALYINLVDGVCEGFHHADIFRFVCLHVFL